MRLLERLDGFVHRMRAQIAVALAPPDRIILDMHDEPDCFFGCCGELVEKGLPVAGAWKQAVEGSADAACLSAEERRLLCELGGQLGMYDAELQLSLLAQYAEKTAVLRRRSEEEYRERSRLHTVCSLLGGALASILII